MLKKVKRFCSLLCCLMLIVSMTVDVHAAEGINLMLTGVKTGGGYDGIEQSAEDAVGQETEDGELGRAAQTEDGSKEDAAETEKDSGENDETKPETESDAKTTEITETAETTEVTGTTETEQDSAGRETETETESDEEVIEEETVEEKAPAADSTDAVSGNYILDDAFVYSADANKTYNTSTTLILGKQRYVYLRFDLSGIDANAEKIVFKGVFSKGNKSEVVVVKESSEYLRDSNGNSDSTEKWTKDNITYNNRPLEGTTIHDELAAWSGDSFEIDLTDFIKDKIKSGAQTACIHFTTKTVDENITAAEIYSSRNESNKPELVVTLAKSSINNIFDDAYVSSAETNTNFLSSKPEQLTFGKQRHVYLRFDLEGIDADAGKIIFQSVFKSGPGGTLVIKESSEYLRTTEGTATDSTEKWTKESITYNNRPLDKENANLAGLENFEWTSGALEIDLTDFIKAKINAGEQTACIHITTQSVEDTGISANDIWSTRASVESNRPKLTVIPAEKKSVYNIYDDAYVSNMKDKADENFKTSTTLQFGKFRHAYIRFDLENIASDANKIVFSGTYNKGTRNPVVVTECNEFLRKDENTDSEEKWTTDNITYNNRPLDTENVLYAGMEWLNTQTKLEIDLTDFIKGKIAKGDKTACIHITTTTVEEDAIGAVEINSSRNDSGKPKLVVSTPNDEKPETLEREIDADNYYNNGYIIQKVIKIKTEDNTYLKVNADGTVTATSDAQQAGLFGLHVYQYDAYEPESYGATKTTYAFEDLGTGKFLTIQNYFAAGDSSKDYYNLKDGKYVIKATAPDVNWNERFDVKYYPESDYYVIGNHLAAYRDSTDAVSSLYVEKDGLKCGKNDDEVPFYFEEVTGSDKLKVMQKVSGDSVKLFWKPVDEDTTPANYAIKGKTQTISYDTENGELYTEISGLSAGMHDFTVVHGGQEAAVKVRIFNHLALAHSQTQLDVMKEHVAKKEEPWYSDYQRLLNEVPYHMADTDFEVKALVGVGRGDPEGHGNMDIYERSSNAAYFNALQWVITGEEKYAKKTAEILNAWADTLKIVDGRDRILGAAISTYRMNNAAELLRYYGGGYSGYSDADFGKYQDMLINVIYPVVQDLGLPMTANGNWDTAAMAAMVSIGAVCDSTEIFERAVYLYQDIHTNGSIEVYVSDWGQSVESYRDQAHAQLGISYLADVCEAAKKQGLDLYGLHDNRLAKAFNWAAQYNLYNTENLKMEPLTDVFGRNRWNKVDYEKINRGELRSVYELPLAHYSKIDGVDVTWMKRAAEAMRPQGYVNNDHLNFGTLTTYNGEATQAPAPYFQLRTRLEPWYQRTWADAEKYGQVQDNIPETLNSYFTVDKSGTVTASVKKADAPFFQLETQTDGTCAVRCVPTNKYLSVKEETYSDGNVIKADADTVGENEKFVLKGTGISFFYLESPSHGNRIVNVNIENESEPLNAKLTVYLGTRATVESNSVSLAERFILVYNTEDVALAVDTSALEAYIEEMSAVNNDDNTYTEESWQNFTEKLDAAKQCVADAKDKGVSQSAVNAALRELQAAYGNLESVKPVVSAPQADIDSGEVLAGEKITLTCATEGAQIYYTTDGSEPGAENGTLYENPITISEAVTIKAVAVKEGFKDSDTVTYEYTISDIAPEKFVYPPKSDTKDGEVAKGAKITLTCVTEGAQIYYTTDGSEPSAENGTLYETPITVNKNVTIKAVAVKGENASVVVTFAYTVKGGGQDEPEPVSAPTADTPSGDDMMKGTKITLACATEGAQIYYTADGSEPSAEKGILYEKPIVIKEDTTIKAIAVKDGVSSVPAVFTYKISVGLKITVDGKIYECKPGDTITTSASYTYTGSAVMPEVAVMNNGEALAKGTDYTVKYANNVKVPAANAKNTQKPKITITGKNNLKGNATLYFAITPKSIAAAESGISTAEPLVVVENKKASPVLYYGSQLLKADRDYTIDQAAKKWTLGDDNGEITLTGKGNYTGERKVRVHVIAKSDLQKFTVKVKPEMGGIVYDGSAHTPQFEIHNTKDANKALTEGDDYYVVAAGDMVSAGTQKFTVVGTGIYTGCSVTKSYTIKPYTDSAQIQIDNTNAAEYTYAKAGVAFAEGDLVIQCKDSVLKEGRDYKVAYSGNKKVTNQAKYKVTFLGNYKGAKNVDRQSGTFKITPADLSALDYKAEALDMAYNKAAVYKAKLFVTVDDVLLKSSDYTVTYKLSDGNPMDKQHKLDLDKIDGTVTAVIQGKGNYTGTIQAEYKVYKPDTMHNLAKTKVTVVDENGRKLKNAAFDGNKKTPALKIEVKDGRTYRELTQEEYGALRITYLNNVYKGKAVVVVNGDGQKLAGSKSVTFSIVSKDITNLK